MTEKKQKQQKKAEPRFLSRLQKERYKSVFLENPPGREGFVFLLFFVGIHSSKGKSVSGSS